MKKFLLLLIVLYAAAAHAQENVFYIAARNGLNMREKPEAAAKVVEKIPYGAKVELKEAMEASKKIVTEGLTGYWRKTSYNGKTGYIIDSYLLPFAPPAAGTKTIADYLPQLSAAFGDKLLVPGGNREHPEEGGYEISKQLYRNGAESHEFNGYEYNSVTYFLPGMSMQQGFILLRMIPEFAEVFGEKDEFPTQNKTLKKGDGDFKITVDKQYFSDVPWIEKISVEFESGAIYSFEMYQIDNQLVIFYGAGV